MLKRLMDNKIVVGALLLCSVYGAAMLFIVDALLGVFMLGFISGGITAILVTYLIYDN